jgi:hypothetical protein
MSHARMDGAPCWERGRRVAIEPHDWQERKNAYFQGLQ